MNNFPETMAQVEAEFEIFYAALPSEVRASASKTAMKAAFYAGASTGVISHAELLKSALLPPEYKEDA